MCEIQGKTFKEESFDIDDEEEEILPDPNLENLTTIAKEITISHMTHKMTKIQEHILNDRVIKISYNSREE